MLHRRPALPARFDIFQQSKNQVRRLEAVCERTQDADAKAALNEAREILAFFERHEALFRELEIEQAMGMLRDLPHSVRTWLLFYREQEMAL